MDPWVKISWSRKWQPTPVFLPGESHGQRSLAGFSPWGRKELDMTAAAAAKSLQSCPTLCNPMAYTVQEFSRPGYWSGQPFPSPGDLPNPGITPRSPTLWVDSLPTELSGKPSRFLWGFLLFIGMVSFFGIL